MKNPLLKKVNFPSSATITNLYSLVENGMDYVEDDDNRFLKAKTGDEVARCAAAGANPNRQPNLPLKWAIHDNDVELVHALLKHGANPNIQTVDVFTDKGAEMYDGDAALHGLWKFRNIDIAKLLLRYGADPSIKNNRGMTVIEVLEAGGLHYQERVIIKLIKQSIKASKTQASNTFTDAIPDTVSFA